MLKSVKQHLPDYTDLYQRDTRWVVQELPHYKFHYFAGSVAEKDIDNIVSQQENAFKNIINTLNLHPTEKINYYLYPSSETKRELMGDEGPAQSVYRDRSIHIIYNENVKPLGEHEDTHILTLEWGTSIGLLQEGIAEYMSGDRLWSGKPLAYWLKEAILKNLDKKIGALMSHQGWLDTPDEEATLWYAIARSWTDYLIKKFSLSVFQKLYVAVDREETAEYNIKIFKKEVGIPFDKVAGFWQKSNRN
jgi:hypothetical protein